MNKLDHTLREWAGRAQAAGGRWDVSIEMDLPFDQADDDHDPASALRSRILHMAEIENRRVALGKRLWEDHGVAPIFDAVSFHAENGSYLLFDNVSGVIVTGVPADKIDAIAGMPEVKSVSSLPTRDNRRLVARLSV